jgi:hypothetical protein
MLEEGVKVFTNIDMNWDGIQGIPLFELDWEEGTPLILKPKCRPISANILEVAEKEFIRLRDYLLKTSNSPVCSNIVVASKATYPFVRICGDYVAINKYIRHGHYSIPLIRSQLDRIQTYSLYADIDFKNAFHQVRIGPVSSAQLSITTPWGSSNHLLCKKVLLKQQESGWKLSTTFFKNTKTGYYLFAYSRSYVRGVVRKDKANRQTLFQAQQVFRLRVREEQIQDIPERRRQDIQDIPPPITRKGMQSFMGTVVICSGFIPDYSVRAIALYNMTAATYDWSNAWSERELETFADIKQAVIESCSLHYPKDTSH